MSHAGYPQIGKDGEHPAMVPLARREPELGEDARDVALDCPLAHEELPRDRTVGSPFGHEVEHLALAPGERIERPLVAPASEHHGDDLRIEHRATGGDAPHGVREPLDVCQLP
jgi:hypothetical protein